MAAMGLVMLLSVATSAGIEPPEEIVQVAAEADLDPVALHGAVNTTQLEPRTYLAMTGELKPPALGPWTWSVWDRLATECEARGWVNPWIAVSPGGTYRGGLQMDATFWRRYGGLVFAPRPDLATREQQIVVAQRGQAVQGWAAWPVCSRRLGLR